MLNVKILNVAQVDYQHIPVGLEFEMSKQSVFTETNTRNYILKTSSIPGIIEEFKSNDMLGLAQKSEEFYLQVKPFEFVYVQKII